MKITFSPVTRISGLLSIDLFANPAGVVSEANVDGEQFRGFEAMLRGRQVTDCIYFTQRICGICSMAHGYTSARMVERIYGIEAPPEMILLQQAMLGAEFLQNHIRHFYLLALPDYLDTHPDTGASIDKDPTGRASVSTPGPEPSRFTAARQKIYLEHYFAAMEAGRKCHEMLAVFGGKIPHQHGLTAGGVTVDPDADRRKQFLSLLEQVRQFIMEIMLPDVSDLAETYFDYLQIGSGPGRFLTFGLFDPRLGGHFPAGLAINGRVQPVRQEEISESIAFSWYERADSEPGSSPEKQILFKPDPVKPAPMKPGAYTWVKAARYQGLACEGGPLARQIVRNIQARPAAGPLPGPAGAMARLQARAMEAVLISGWIDQWLHDLPQKGQYFIPPEKPVLTSAFQANDAPRGPLLHAVTVSGAVSSEVSRAAIESYQVITPSTWNFSPKDEAGERGPVETALIGCKATPENMTEPGRIIRSFDPCLTCATHLIDQRGTSKMTVRVNI